MMKLTIDRPNLLGALDSRAAEKELRYYLRGLIFDTNRQLAATDGHLIFVGQFAEELDAPIIIGFDHKPPARFTTCEIDTTLGIARYTGTANGLAMAGGIHIIDAKACDWRRATRANWREPDASKPPHHSTAIDAIQLATICRIAARFPKAGKLSPMTLRPGSTATDALRIDINENAWAIIMPIRKPKA